MCLQQKKRLEQRQLGLQVQQERQQVALQLGLQA
jgi:hypothetical protein